MYRICGLSKESDNKSAKFWGCSSVGRGKLLYSAAGLSKGFNLLKMQSSGVVAQLVEVSCFTVQRVCQKGSIS